MYKALTLVLPVCKGLFAKHSQWAMILFCITMLSACGSVATSQPNDTQTEENGTGLATNSSVVTQTPLTDDTDKRPEESSPQAASALGTMIGEISLEDTGDQVLGILGVPQTDTVAQGVGTPQWEFDEGVIIDVWGLEDDSKVRRIITIDPFTGATAEGFQLGFTEAQFEDMYSEFNVYTVTDTQKEVEDEQGTLLNVEFTEGVATRITLEDIRCPENVSWCE